VKAVYTLRDLVDAAFQQLASLPPPPNGQVQQMPDERMLRYYLQLGLLDRPAASRGRAALYNKRHLAQLVAIKRLQQVGKSLAEIQALWSTIDDRTLMRISGLDGVDALSFPRAQRDIFWKTPQAVGKGNVVYPADIAAELPPLPRGQDAARERSIASGAGEAGAPAPPPVTDELRVELAPGVALVLSGAAKKRLLSALQLTSEEP
jgi:hypothetical protein